MRESDSNIALLISGEGTTAEAVIKACQHREISYIHPVVVVASRYDAPGLYRADALKVPTEVVRRSDYSNKEVFGDALLTVFKKYGVDLVSQNGWLPMMPGNVIDQFAGRIINQHPGRLPAFGGKGMYGTRVTCATLAYFDRTGEPEPWTASVVHHVTRAYDEGPLIQVKRLDLPPAGKAQELTVRTESVQRQLVAIEHANVISVLNAFGEGTVPTAAFDNTPFQDDLLQEAKGLAMRLYP